MLEVHANQDSSSVLKLIPVNVMQPQASEPEPPQLQGSEQVKKCQKISKFDV